MTSFAPLNSYLGSSNFGSNFSTNFMGDGGFYQPEVNPFEMQDNFGIDYGFGQGGGTTQNNSNSGFFGDITAKSLLKGIAPMGAALIGGRLGKESADSYGQSAIATAAITAMANQQAQEQQFGFGLRGLDKSAAMRIGDANQQLAMQNSAPFRNIEGRRGAQAIRGSGIPTANALAGRYMMYA